MRLTPSRSSSVSPLLIFNGTTGYYAQLTFDSSSNFNLLMQTPKPGACTSALAGAGAGNLTNGAYSYKITFVTAAGETEAGSVSNTTTVVDASTNGKINLTSIPTGVSGIVTSRKVYRTIAGGSAYKLQSTIADNTTTTLTDNTADASLTTAAPTGNTTNDARLTITNAGSMRTLAGSASAPAWSFLGDTNTGVTNPFGDYLGFVLGGTLAYAFSASGLEFGSSQDIRWVSAIGSSSDLILARDAANVLAQKRTTNAQEFRVYGTTTGSKYAYLKHDGTDGKIDVSAGTLQLGGTATTLRLIDANLELTEPTTNVAMLAGASAGAAALRISGGNGGYISRGVFSEALTILAAATTDTSFTYAAGTVILAVAVYVVTAIPTAATFTVTGAVSSTVFNTAAVSTAQGSSDKGTAAGAYYNAAAQAIRITPNLTPAAATGVVRVVGYSYSIQVPTS